MISYCSQYGPEANNIWNTLIYNGSALNPDLTWETSEQTDLGLDVEMFKNRLSVSLDYFDKRTFNLIQTQSMGWPSTMGLDPELMVPLVYPVVGSKGALRFKLIGAIRLTKTFLISYRVTSRI